MSSLRTGVVHHELPEDFQIHPNSPWKPLASLADIPYILTKDSFGGANNVWCIDSDSQEASLQVTTSLYPGLPATSLDLWIRCFPEHNILVIKLVRKPRVSWEAVLRVYSLGSGTMLQEIDLPGESAHTPPRRARGFLMVTVTSAADGPRAFIYKVSSKGLQEVRCFGVDPTITVQLSGQKHLVPIHISSDGDPLITSTYIPSDKISLKFHYLGKPYTATLSAYFPRSDYLAPKSVVSLIDTSLTFIMEESCSEDDYNPSRAQSTVCCISLPDLSLTWRTPLPYPTLGLTHHPKLRSYAVVGLKNRHTMFSVAFLNDGTGEILKEETFSCAPDGTVFIPNTSFPPTCTSNDDFVAVTHTGELLVLPLVDILHNGVPRNEAGKVIMQKSALRPHPINTKARKAGDNWRWVDHAVIGSKTVVLFPVKGPDMYVVKE